MWYFRLEMGGGGQCIARDPISLFYFRKEILQILYTLNLTDVLLNSSYCRHICNFCFVYISRVLCMYVYETPLHYISYALMS